MNLKFFRDSSTDQKCELLKDELEKTNNRIDNLKGNETDRGVAFVLLPFILMVGYNVANEIFEKVECISQYKIAIFIIILLVLWRKYKTFYKRAKK